MRLTTTFLAIGLASASIAHAAVSPEEAARLGKDLTPWGAEKAGNKEGTIPPYTGGLAVDLMGAGYDSNKVGNQGIPDPFKDEKPLFRITVKNLDQYADKLTEATRGLFKVYPDFYMDIYPTHRTVNYPQYFLDSSIKNATRCKVEQDGEAIKGCKGGMPFPIPKTGYEVMWNLLVGQYMGWGNDTANVGLYTDRTGRVTVTSINKSWYQYPFQDPRYSLEDYESRSANHGSIVYRVNLLRYGPPRVAGESLLTQYYTNGTPPASWTYQPGNRRVRVSPNVSYDYPIPSGGGAAFFDEVQTFSGRMDRFDFKLVGKKEMIIPYSNYKMAYGDMNQVYQGGKPNPAFTRWELHRTWVVEATRKPGARHAFAKRRYYFDEDHTGAAVVDCWDDTGKVTRGNYASLDWIWDYQTSLQHYWNSDLVAGSMFHAHYNPGTGISNRFRNGNTGVGGDNNGPMYSDNDFTPEALARRSQR